jgi:hypothetical protein
VTIDAIDPEANTKSAIRCLAHLYAEEGDLGKRLNMRLASERIQLIKSLISQEMQNLPITQQGGRCYICF